MPLLCLVRGTTHIWDFTIPEFIQLPPPFRRFRLQGWKELLRINAGISRDILNPFKYPDCSSLFHVIIALKMKPLNYLKHRRKFICSVGFIQRNQMMRELSQINVEQIFIFVEGTMLLPPFGEGRTRFKKRGITCSFVIIASLNRGITLELTGRAFNISSLQSCE